MNSRVSKISCIQKPGEYILDALQELVPFVLFKSE